VQRKQINKILIANRGEIAVRIIRACHELGIQTVAVHSKADEDALHVKLARESICIGAAPAKDSYLNIASIMSAAIATQADAVHPGYGFLSENFNFAEICKSCGVEFIGPSVRNMKMMGDKARARRAADKAGIPTIKGHSLGINDGLEALKIAEEVTGFPILLKACAGGGGRGMKIIESADNFVSIFNTAQKEVEAAFGDPSLLVERYLSSVRHIEVQIAGDNYNNLIHIGLRDCSIQRRYQKLIEESPSIGLSSELEQRILADALKLAASVGYSSLGTIEFLVDLKRNEHFFIEMNTRLQVEHPVTEMLTDLDLVKMQILIAMGERLEIKQDDVRIDGHVIEVRINAEDYKTQMPSPGIISSYHPPGGNSVRVDSALYSGYRIQPFYDSLISKLIVKAPTRQEAIIKTLVALEEYIIEGISTNIDLHRIILEHPDFVSGNFDTKFLYKSNIC
jgi:acetyl-CoA carboxylase, biotin carboxylase subunit